MTPGLPELAYLAWALERYGMVRFDLASSGLAPLTVADIGEPAEVFARTTDPRAAFAFTEAVAERFRVSLDRVAPALGATHGIWCAYAATLAAGDEALVEAPTYEPLLRTAVGFHARVIPYVRDLDRGASIDVDAVARLVTARTRLIVVSNLHNPTGAYVDDDVLLALAAVAKKAGAHLLVDEVYRDLRDDAGAAPTSVHLADNIIVTSSLTKVYALPWARAGWILGPPDVIARARVAALHSVGGFSSALASAGSWALGHMDHVRARSVDARANVDRSAALLSAWVAARPGLRFDPQPSSIFGFVVETRGRDLRPLIERAIDEQQVIVAPGSFFGFPAGMRVRYGAIPDALLEEGLERLGRVFEA